jgi:hypothetical protein
MAVILTIDKDLTTLKATDANTGRIIYFYKDDIIIQGTPYGSNSARIEVKIRTDNDNVFYSGSLDQFALPTVPATFADFLVKIAALLNFNF